MEKQPTPKNLAAICDRAKCHIRSGYISKWVIWYGKFNFLMFLLKQWVLHQSKLIKQVQGSTWNAQITPRCWWHIHLKKWELRIEEWLEILGWKRLCAWRDDFIIRSNSDLKIVFGGTLELPICLSLMVVQRWSLRILKTNDEKPLKISWIIDGSRHGSLKRKKTFEKFRTNVAFWPRKGSFYVDAFGACDSGPYLDLTSVRLAWQLSCNGDKNGWYIMVDLLKHST